MFQLEALLLENVSREKTPLQKIQEGKTWEYIASNKAVVTQYAQADVGREHGKEGGRKSKIEQLKQNTIAKSDSAKPLGDARPQGVSPDTSSNPPQTPNTQNNNKKKKDRAPKTIDNVAAQVGLGSGKTYERGKKASDTADELEKQGHIKEAQTLRDIMYHYSISLQPAIKSRFARGSSTAQFNEPCHSIEMCVVWLVATCKMLRSGQP